MIVIYIFIVFSLLLLSFVVVAADG